MTLRIDILLNIGMGPFDFGTAVCDDQKLSFGDTGLSNLQKVEVTTQRSNGLVCVLNFDVGPWVIHGRGGRPIDVLWFERQASDATEAFKDCHVSGSRHE